MVFVVKDLESKIDVLATLAAERPDTHGNIVAMVMHEVDTDPTLRQRKKDPPSASAWLTLATAHNRRSAACHRMGPSVPSPGQSLPRLGSIIPSAVRSWPLLANLGQSLIAADGQGSLEPSSNTA
jgi:hypothetical protein